MNNYVQCNNTSAPFQQTYQFVMYDPDEYIDDRNVAVKRKLENGDQPVTKRMKTTNEQEKTCPYDGDSEK